MATPPLKDASFACALSRRRSSTDAASEVAEQALEQLGAQPDLAFLFFTADHVADADQVARQLAERLQTDCLVGGSGESIVGGSTEVEGEPGMSLWLGSLPNTECIPTRLEFTRTPDGGRIVGWPDPLVDTWPEDSTLVILGDPFTFPADLLLERLLEDQPGIPIVGGMASAGQEPGRNRLILGAGCYADGAVGVRIAGGIRVQSVVSQGCRPIGEHFVITQSERNVIHSLGGLRAFDQLEKVFQTLSTTEQRSVQKGLHVGRVVTEYQDTFEQGDFLVRNVVNVDRDKGTIAIGDFVRPGQTVQFHIRDADSADGELRQLLAAAAERSTQPRAALLFTCNGRGTRLFPEPHHDAAAVQTACGPIPVAGLFAAGEIGPIGGKNFMHGFTASIAIFEATE